MQTRKSTLRCGFPIRDSTGGGVPEVAHRREAMEAFILVRDLYVANAAGRLSGH